MGYGGVSPSVAVEFDTYQNSSSGDADGNHVGININGALTSVVQAPVRERMNDGGIWYAWLDYDGSLQTMEARIARTPDRPTLPIVSMAQIDLPKILGRADVYVGFMSKSTKYLYTFLQLIPQYTDVPPNIEAKRIISYFSAVLCY